MFSCCAADDSMAASDHMEWNQSAKIWLDRKDTVRRAMPRAFSGEVDTGSPEKMRSLKEK
jgi:hypothetical protein